MGDSNDLEGPGFHSVNLRKVWGKGASAKGRAVFHQSADEGFVNVQEFRCAVQVLCTTENSQSANEFGGQVISVV